MLFWILHANHLKIGAGLEYKVNVFASHKRAHHYWDCYLGGNFGSQFLELQFLLRSKILCLIPWHIIPECVFLLCRTKLLTSKCISVV